MKSNLIGAHIKTLTASSLNDALTIAKSNKIDILISDFSLGEATGLQIFSKLKVSQPNARCLLFTSRPDQVSMIEAIRQGVEDVLIKPLNENILLQSVHKLWQTELLKRRNAELVERLQETVDALIEKDSLLQVIYKHTPDAIMLFKRNGQIIEAHSISAGLDYPGVGPEHSWLKDIGRVNYVSATDTEALAAFHRVTRVEGIMPALETAHALAYAEKLAAEMTPDQHMIINLSGRGDKDILTVAEIDGIDLGAL